MWNEIKHHRIFYKLPSILAVMKRGKVKSQTTIFIIVAIALLAIISIFFYIQKTTQLNSQETTSLDTQSIYDFVTECLQTSTENAIEKVGLQGGDTTKKLSNNISIYYEKGKSFLPPKTLLEENIAEEIQKNIPDCTLNFYSFSDYEISQNAIKVSTEIDIDKVNIIARYPLTITKGETTHKIENFKTEVNVPLGKIHAIISEINDDQLLHPTTLCLSCLYTKAEENNLFVELTEYDKQTTIISFIDKKTIVNKDFFRYNFAHVYEPENEN